MSEPWRERVVIGDATLYLGDAREIVPTLSDRSIDFVFTDPPFGHNNNNGDLLERWEKALGRPVKNGNAEARPIENDGPEANDLVRWAFEEFARLLARGGCCCCCCGGGGPDPQFARWSLWMDEYLAFKQMIIWDKGPMGMGWHYRRSYETVLVGEKRGGPCRWYDQSDSIENIIRPGQYGIRKIIPTAADHPTPKPVELAAHFIRLHSSGGDLVLDPFMGGGSTAEAALALGRRFIGIDCDERWFQMTCRKIAAAASRPRLFGYVRQRAEQITLPICDMSER